MERLFSVTMKKYSKEEPKHLEIFERSLVAYKKRENQILVKKIKRKSKW